MASPSITIKIDFGSESGSGAGNIVAVSGAVPTPASAGGSAAASQFEGVVPTPFDIAAHSMAQAESGAPAPSPSLVLGGSAGSDLGNVPTPLSAGGFLPQGAGQPSMVPTPMDSVHGNTLTGDQAPTPDFGSMGQPEGTPPAPSHPAETSGKRGRKEA